jgi:adenosine/AMP kinase
MDIKAIPVRLPEGVNVIIGQAHFIKTAEDLYEALVNGAPGVKFGLAFSEASGVCLIRHEGNDSELVKFAIETLMEIGAGHSFVIFLKNAYPINFLTALKNVPEVVNIFCATANPLQVLVARSEQGGGIVGVIDGFAPKGIEDENQKQARKKFLRDIGYKL